MKPVVIGIIFRRKLGGEIEILTQKRIVKNPPYDPLYDGTWEAVGETLEEGEGVIQALVRGIAEECGSPNFKPVGIYGADGKGDWTTGKGDHIICVEPIAFVQQLGPPQPWIGPCFAVEVHADWEPDHGQSDGEAGHPKWWGPEELALAIDNEPKNFMGLHMPALRTLCELVIDGEFND